MPLLLKLISIVLEKSDQAIGRSRDGLTTKIHTRSDALGNPTGFYLIDGSDELLDVSISQTWLANKAYDDDTRVIERIKAVQGKAFIASKYRRLQPRDFDKELYKARHLIENFFAKVKQYRAIATRYDKLASHFLSAVNLVSCVFWLN